MPFSGKTTLAKSVSEYLHSSYVSLDEINEARGLFGGDGIPVEEWEKTHAIAMQQLHNLMEFQQDVVYTAVEPTVERSWCGGIGYLLPLTFSVIPLRFRCWSVVWKCSVRV